MADHSFLKRLSSTCGALLALSLGSCSAPFGYSLELRGGWDPPQRLGSGDDSSQGDRIYMVAERIDGIGSGLCALEVPPDWRMRSTHAIQPGVMALDQPIEARWVTRKADLAEADLGRPRGRIDSPFWKGEPSLIVLKQARSSQADSVFASPSAFTYDGIQAALESGGDAYVLVPKKRFLKHGFSIYGATGPPMVWVHLGDVEVESGEGPFGFGLARTVGAVAYGIDAVYLAGVSVVGGVAMAPFGGFVIFEKPFVESLGGAPW